MTGSLKMTAGCVLLVAAMWLWVRPVDVAAQSQDSVEIKADNLHIQSEKKQAVFKGNVRFVYENIRFTCARMIIRYTDDGGLQTLTATGNVTILQKGAKAVAERADMDIETNIIVLSGKPRFTRDGSTLSGKTVRVNVLTGEVDVTEATGTFILKQGTIQ